MVVLTIPCIDGCRNPSALTAARAVLVTLGLLGNLHSSADLLGSGVELGAGSMCMDPAVSRWSLHIPLVRLLISEMLRDAHPSLMD